MMSFSNRDGETVTAEDFREMIARLDVIADDIVILTRERDEAQAEVARLTALGEPGRWVAHGEWICQQVSDCTCGGSGLDYGPQHQPGCGLVPLSSVGENAAPLVAEHNAALDALAAVLTVTS